MFSIGGGFANQQGPKCDIPLNPEHGGPILCMDNNNDIVVTGSTDHGLRVYNLSDGKQTKELFSKKYGHHEWVTTCQILNSRRMIIVVLFQKLLQIKNQEYFYQLHMILQ